MKKRIFLCLGPGQMCVFLSLLEYWKSLEDQSQYEDYLFIAAHDYRDTPTHAPYVSAIEKMAEFWPFAKIYDFCKLSIDHGSRWDMKNQTFLDAFREELIQDSGIDSCDMIITTRNWRVDYGILFWCFPKANFVCMGDGITGLLEYSPLKSLPQPSEIWHTFPVYSYGYEIDKYQNPDKFHLIPYRYLRSTILSLRKSLKDQIRSELPPIEPSSNVVFYVSQNLAETGVIPIENELNFFLHKIVHPNTGSIILIKPHPRDSAQKINAYTMLAQKANTQVINIGKYVKICHFPAEVFPGIVPIKKIITCASTSGITASLLDNIEVKMYPHLDNRYRQEYTNLSAPRPLLSFIQKFSRPDYYWDGISVLFSKIQTPNTLYPVLQETLEFFSHTAGLYNEGPQPIPLNTIRKTVTQLKEQTGYHLEIIRIECCLAIYENNFDAFRKSLLQYVSGTINIPPAIEKNIQDYFTFSCRCQQKNNSVPRSRWVSKTNLLGKFTPEFRQYILTIYEELFRLNNRIFFENRHSAPEKQILSRKSATIHSASPGAETIDLYCPPGTLITIGYYCKIGSHTSIQSQQDISIGDGCVILSGSCVQNDIPPFCIVTGHPAAIVAIYDFENKKWLQINSDTELYSIIEKRTVFPAPNPREIVIILNQLNAENRV